MINTECGTIQIVPSQLDVDVLDITDLRFEGGTAGSVAEEIKAQAAAGYTTAVTQLDGPLVAATSPVNPRVRRCIEAGQATLVMPHQTVRAKVVVLRHPAVLQRATSELPEIETEQLVMVANAPPRDIDGYEHYSVREVRAAALDTIGVEPTWAPIGPLVREAIAGDLGGQQALDDDWVNIIDVDAWQVPRPTWRGDRPVIGRHSRDNPQKWPADLATLEQVYPTDGSMDVRILGGAAPVEELYGEIPEAWHVLPFGAMSARDFLAGLDFFVYFHNPRWVEAFGRTILEALASGAVAILPPHFEKLFGGGALYCEPRGVQPLIRRLYADRPAYGAQAERGQAVVRQRFGYEAHAARIAALIGPSGTKWTAAAPPPGAPSSRTGPTAPRTLPPSASSAPADQRGEAFGQSEKGTSSLGRERRLVRPSDPHERVLLVSSNGSGMGHLTRLLAYAQHAGEGIDPYFLSLSQAVPLVATFGYPYEYLPSMNATGLEPSRWQAYFADRLVEAIDRLRPQAVVFDGTVPYERIPDVRARHPHVPWVWSRRGMWYRGHNKAQLAKADWFDLVVEPGDFARPADRGATANARSTRVGPVTVLDHPDLADRPTARRALGLEPDGPAALVTLGAGNINDAASDIRVVLDALRATGQQICVTAPAIADRLAITDQSVHVVREYPLSRYYPAFDVAVSASGYNSLHELLRFGVPTLFIPNRETSLDDQQTRARYVAGQGWAHMVDAAEPATTAKLIDDLLANGPEMVARVASIDPGNGAAEVINHVRDLIGLEAGLDG